jgi:serine protease Do
MGQSDSKEMTTTRAVAGSANAGKTVTFTIKKPTIRRPKISGLSVKRLLPAILLLILATFAGFLGGRLSQNSSLDSGSLSSQKQIVTSSSDLIRHIAQEVGPSVVSINITATRGISIFGYAPTEQAAGTGIIISKDGVIMTNRHVVPAGTTKVSVTLSDGTEYNNVEVLGRTNATDSLDVAFLKIRDLKGASLTPAIIGDSSQTQVGDSVVAIGNALGQFQNTVTAGIVSGFGRNVQAGSNDLSSTPEDLGNLIQTDAAINEGNSGGPLVNLNNQVIGMNTAIASNAENIGFAIPINDLRGLIDQVLKTGSFKRPYLGVRYVTLSKSFANEYGLDQISGAYLAPRGISGDDPVVTGSPADKAGLRSGDVITKVNGTNVSQDKPLATLLNAYAPNEVVHLTVVRSGKTIEISARLGVAANSQ